jgi:regulator of RNase E activity RraA
MTTMAMRLGAVGMVTDGGLRDVHEVRRLGFAYFARYVVVSHGNFGVVDVGEPVRLDGQEIKTGDILHGDANGIVIVPREVLEGLPEAVEKVRTRERATMEFVNSPEYTIAEARKRAGY